MSFKQHKGSGDRISKINLANGTKTVSKPTPKRVIMSKRVGNCSEKSCSTGIISNDSSLKPKKTTKSELCFHKKHQGRPMDYCRKCGDTSTHNTQYQAIRRNSINPPSSSNGHSTVNQNGKNGNATTSKNGSKVSSSISRNNIVINYKTKENGIRSNGRASSIKQYYKNENFQPNDSIHDIDNDFRRISLDTIKELPENHGSSNLKTADDCNVYEIYSDSEEIGFFDINDGDNIDNLKKFRDDNYFECHSVKSRVESRENVSATSLTNHKCVYRFYLNDRLFPVPLSTDHHDTVRCVECHLPMDLKMDLEQSDKANGTIQAKVKLDTEKDAQDMILFLPVKDTLIIKERRKEIKEKEEVVYFGVIKLDSFGNSVFNSTMPTDSFALKYQKGYREHKNSDVYKYRGIEKDDVIII